MSVTHYHVCDHCGKRLDDMHDYAEYELTKFIDADLCKDCLNELGTIIKNFLHREDVTL